MTVPQDSTDAERVSGDTTPRTDEEDHARSGDSRLHELTRDQLEEALETDSPSEKDFHVRSALQALVIAEEARHG